MADGQLEAYRMMMLGGLLGVCIGAALGAALFAWAWWSERRR